MQAFATIEQYDARYPNRVVADEVLEECLLSATATIMNALNSRGIDYENPDELMAFNLMDVCRSVANRIVPTESAYPQGITQASMSAVGFTEAYTFGSSYGVAKLLPGELKQLGISGAIGFARPLYGILERGDDAD